MKTAPYLVKYYISEHFSRVSGRGYTCCKLLSLLTPIYIQVGISQKVIAILGYQEAAKMPAIKVFVASKLSILYSKWPDFGAKKTLTAGQFGAP